jgi:pyruvate dehydrogenase E2 component (dihydrolipoamide acetyltransferase)
MAREFLLPDLGSGLKEGEIVRWLVKVGDQVTTDDLLCEVETEKAVIEVPVPYDGTVVSLACEEGETIPVGSVLAVFDESGGASGSPATASDPAQTQQPPGQQAEQQSVQDSASQPASEPVSTAVSGERLRAMPATRRLAKEKNVDLTAVTGTGRSGRITKKDVLEWLKQEAQTRSDAPPAPAVTADERIRLSKLRKTIAERMSQSWREIPHIFTRIEADASGFLEVRTTLSDVYNKKMPVEALLIRAVLPALKEFPEFNATLDGDELVLHKNYNISIAVDTDDGLVLPTVHGADQLGMLQLTSRLVDLLPKAVQRKASPDELSGGTFTVNNIGALGHLIGTSIIPYGTTAILSVGRAVEKPIVRDGGIVVVPMMEITLSFDHRVIDGGLAQKFMANVRRNIEEAARLLA